VARVIVETYGRVPKEFENFVVEVLNRVYSRTDRPYVVYVKLFESRELMLEELSVGHGYEGVDFIAFHDARDGIPKVYLPYDVLKSLGWRIAEGVVVHEAVHTVLHGDVLSYILLDVGDCRILAERFGADLGQLYALAYYLSVAVKDYEVSKYVVEVGLVDNYVEYVKYVLSLEPEEVSAIEALGQDFRRLLALAALLKQYATAKPFEHMSEVRERVAEFLNKLPKDYSSALRDLVDMLDRSSGDLSKKVNSLCSLMNNMM